MKLTDQLVADQGFLTPFVQRVNDEHREHDAEELRHQILQKTVRVNLQDAHQCRDQQAGDQANDEEQPTAVPQ